MIMLADPFHRRANKNVNFKYTLRQNHGLEWIHTRRRCLLLLLSISQTDVQTPHVPDRPPQHSWHSRRRDKNPHPHQHVHRRGDPKHIVVIPKSLGRSSLSHWSSNSPSESLDLDVSRGHPDLSGVTHTGPVSHVHVSKSRCSGFIAVIDSIFCSPNHTGNR